MEQKIKLNKGFGSDNHSGVHPELMKALVESNNLHCPSYGTDPYTLEFNQVAKKIFGKNAESHFVFNGTAANILCLSTMLKSYHSVLCSDVSHLNVDECGAPEFFTGAKLIQIPTMDGKIILEEADKKIIRKGDQHFSQVAAISITQPTELGTLYSLEELKLIKIWAKKNNLYVHMDGARLANACFRLNCSFDEITKDIDVLSLGGTKNGFMMGEAVIILNPNLQKDFKFLRKQLAQLPSKSRFIASPFIKYFENDLWKSIAKHSCEMADYLNQKLQAVEEIKITRHTQSNAVFAVIPKKWIKPLREKYFFYVWDESTFECRLMTSWDTNKNEIDDLIETIKEIRNEISTSALS